MKHVGLLEAKTHLSALVDSVEHGNGEVIIQRRGRPVAKLVAYKARRTVPDDFAARVRAIRAEAASLLTDGEPFDWKAAVNDGRV